MKEYWLKYTMVPTEGNGWILQCYICSLKCRSEHLEYFMEYCTNYTAWTTISEKLKLWKILNKLWQATSRVSINKIFFHFCILFMSLICMNSHFNQYVEHIKWCSMLLKENQWYERVWNIKKKLRAMQKGCPRREGGAALREVDKIEQ